MSMVNAAMAAAWDGPEGEQWARHARQYDRVVEGYQRWLMAAAAIAPGSTVLDIGCGTGETSRAAAVAAGAGSVLGVDLSTAMLDEAARRATAAGIGNVRFVRADAQVHRFEAAAFDLAISRFGVMFFANPVAAFANIAAALRPGGRLVVVAWRPLAGDWQSCIREAPRRAQRPQPQRRTQARCSSATPTAPPGGSRPRASSRSN